ncbi:uncharacterized protein EDB93DRAFT_582006 [Suillus bovinus]|uniref:uncharacterized protein n=1 Tax=Suillus bovinus TaxID=48563 RepID=UPI001B85C364|nr:uncharacterized protein EDB93DRAFT_582006 [Suillus bovinus]KAG2143555.1 hypothetical protein EDB93DRAFT_582006 [Suillus bovinus]
MLQSGIMAFTSSRLVYQSFSWTFFAHSIKHMLCLSPNFNPSTLTSPSGLYQPLYTLSLVFSNGTALATYSFSLSVYSPDDRVKFGTFSTSSSTHCAMILVLLLLMIFTVTNIQC